MSLPVVVAFKISEDFRIIGVEELTEESAESVFIFPAAKISCELFFCIVLFTSKYYTTESLSVTVSVISLSVFSSVFETRIDLIIEVPAEGAV